MPHGTIDQLLFVSDKRHAVVENGDVIVYTLVYLLLDQEGLNDTLMTAINQLCGVERISYFLSSTNFNQKVNSIPSMILSSVHILSNNINKYLMYRVI